MLISSPGTKRILCRKLIWFRHLNRRRRQIFNLELEAPLMKQMPPFHNSLTLFLAAAVKWSDKDEYRAHRSRRSSANKLILRMNNQHQYIDNTAEWGAATPRQCRQVQRCGSRCWGKKKARSRSTPRNARAQQVRMAGWRRRLQEETVPRCSSRARALPRTAAGRRCGGAKRTSCPPACRHERQQVARCAVAALRARKETSAAAGRYMPSARGRHGRKMPRPP